MCVLTFTVCACVCVCAACVSCVRDDYICRVRVYDIVGARLCACMNRMRCVYVLVGTRCVFLHSLCVRVRVYVRV